MVEQLLYCLSLVDIYIGVHDHLGVQVKAGTNPSLSMFPKQSWYSTSPRSHNGSDADDETGEESEGKQTVTPHSRNGRCIAEVMARVEIDKVAQARR